MYLIDTNFLVDYLSGKEEFVAKFIELSKSDLHVSVITCAELLSGAEDEQIKEVNDFLNSFRTIPVTDDLSRKAGITRAKLRKKGYKKTLADILIGQTALEYNLILVTGNPKDFPQIKERKLLMAFPD